MQCPPSFLFSSDITMKREKSAAALDDSFAKDLNTSRPRRIKFDAKEFSVRHFFIPLSLSFLTARMI